MTRLKSARRHLSPEELSSWAVGEQSIPMLEHVASCAACRARVERFDATMSQFGLMVRRWSQQQPQRAMVRAPVCKVQRFWLAPIAGLLFLIFVMLHQYDSAAWVHSKQQEDAALLAQISQEVSRTVPAAMDPLSSLVSGQGMHTVAENKPDGDGADQ